MYIKLSYLYSVPEDHAKSVEQIYCPFKRSTWCFVNSNPTWVKSYSFLDVPDEPCSRRYWPSLALSHIWLVLKDSEMYGCFKNQYHII